MSEIIWYETNMTSNTTPPPLVASASTSSTNYPAYYAFDGVTTGANNVWASTAVNSWLMIDYGQVKVIDKVRLTPRRSSNLNQTPKDFYIEGSIDGSTWVSIRNFSNITDWVEFESKEYDLSGEEFRYLRINHTATNGATIASWQEVQFGEIKKEQRLILKNPITNQHYSLADKTLILLPDASDETVIAHGIETGKEITLDEDFDKVNYIVGESTSVGEGRVFKKTIDNTSNIIINISI